MATANPTAPVRAHSPQSIRRSRLEIPAVIAGSVDLLKLSGALALAGLVGRFDGGRELLVIEPAPVRCPHCRGTRLDEDAVCDVCAGTGHSAG